MNQEVAALEQEVFGKSYPRDPLPSRLSRLEATVFPNDKPATDRSLPERVQRLAGIIPLSPQAGSSRIAQRSKSKKNGDDLDDMDDLDLNGMTGAVPQTKGPSGLSKIINSMSNLLMGGGNFVGGYPMGALTPDPQTGLLYDRMSGNLVDPTTGVVVGQRGMGMGMTGMGMGMGGMGMGGMGMGNGFGGIGISPGMGFGSFGSGFSPYTMPYGGYRSGIGFGMGSFGRMWP